MDIQSIRCAMPGCSGAEEKQTTCSLISRITAVVLGGIALIVGVLALSGIYAIGTLSGSALAGLGGMLLLSACLKCVANEKTQSEEIGVKLKAEEEKVDAPIERGNESTAIPFSPEKFRVDRAYRKEQLVKKSWFSDHSPTNKRLIHSIDSTEFRDIELDALPKNVQKDFYEDCEIVCEIIHSAKRFDRVEDRHAEFKKIFDQLIASPANLKKFLAQFLDWREENDTLLTVEFPVVFVKEVLKGSDAERLILALFSPGFKVALLKSIVPLLNESEIAMLRNIFTKNNQSSRCYMHLKYIPESA